MFGIPVILMFGIIALIAVVVGLALGTKYGKSIVAKVETAVETEVADVEKVLDREVVSVVSEAQQIANEIRRSLTSITDVVAVEFDKHVVEYVESDIADLGLAATEAVDNAVKNVSDAIIGELTALRNKARVASLAAAQAVKSVLPLDPAVTNTLVVLPVPVKAPVVTTGSATA